MMIYTAVTHSLQRGCTEIRTPGTDGTDRETLCAKLYDGINKSKKAIFAYISHYNHLQSIPICCWTHQPDYQYNCLSVVALLSPTIGSCDQHNMYFSAVV